MSGQTGATSQSEKSSSKTNRGRLQTSTKHEDEVLLGACGGETAAVKKKTGKERSTSWKDKQAPKHRSNPPTSKKTNRGDGDPQRSRFARHQKENKQGKARVPNLTREFSRTNLRTRTSSSASIKSDCSSASDVSTSSLKGNSPKPYFVSSTEKSTPKSKIDCTRTAVVVDFKELIPLEDLTTYLRDLFRGPEKYEFVNGEAGDDCKSISRVHLSFKSASQAAEFLKTRDDEFDIAVWQCSEDEFAKVTNQSLMAEHKIKAQFLKMEHWEKISTLEQKLKQKRATSKQLSLDKATARLQEIDAIESQKLMLTRQVEEFEFFMKRMESSVNAHQEIDPSRRAVLANAFLCEFKKFKLAFPMYAHKTDIVGMVQRNQVSILLADTGSGKSTQVVQYLVTNGLFGSGKIICTQPRKISAITLAERVASELNSEVGEVVGYKVGMQSKCGPESQILYMTDHKLLDICRNDPLFSQFACIVVDEAHERSLHTDLLLGMIKRCLPQRPELRVIITSATIEPRIFVDFFKDLRPPVYRVSGKTFPVEIEYSDANPSEDGDYIDRAVDKAKQIHLEEDEKEGGILVFLTSGLETEKAVQKLTKLLKNKVVILQHHGRLPPHEQKKVFQDIPPGFRKIVFATNAVETSVTIPGMKYVIDSGMVKAAVYDHNKNKQVLKVMQISQSSANQRKGRAGRTSPGKCFRLYTESYYDEMDASSKPDILCCHLGSALLKLLSYEICDINSFDFVESPPVDALTNAAVLLEYLGATEDGRLTEMGRKMARLSVEPRLAKMLLMSLEMGLKTQGIILAAISTVGGSVFFRAGSKEEKIDCDKRKIKFCEERGDIITMLNVYITWNAIPEREQNKWCMENSINAKSMRIARDNYRELLNTVHCHLSDLQFDNVEDLTASPEALDKLSGIILECFGFHLCFFSGHVDIGYHLASDPSTMLHVHPSSALMMIGNLPQWVVYESVLVTSKEYMMNVSAVDESVLFEFVEKNQHLKDVYDWREELLLEPHVVDRLGSFTLSKFCGPRYIAFKEFKEYVSDNCEGLMALDVNREKGEIALYVRSYDEPTAVPLLEVKLSDIVEELVSEVCEVPLEPSSRQRIVLKQGLSANELLLDGDFCSVIIQGTNYEDDDVRSFLEEYGPLQQLIPFTRSRLWGKATFVESKDAKMAIECTELTVQPDKANQESTECKISLEWCRRPNNGIAFISFYGESEIEEGSLTQKYLDVLSVGDYPARLNRQNENELTLRNIPRYGFGERELRNYLVEHRVNMAHVERFTVAKQKVQNSSKSDYTQLRRRIENYLENNDYDATLFRVVIQNCTEKSFTFRAMVFVLDEDVSEHMAGFLAESETPMSFPDLKIHKNVSVKFFITRDVCLFIEKRLSRVQTNIADKFNVTSRLKDLPNGRFQMELDAPDFRNLSDARREVDRVVRGTSVVLKENEFKCLQTGQGRDFLKRLEKAGKLLIKLDFFVHKVTLFGPELPVETATKALKDHLANLTSALLLEIPLKGEGMPRGLMKSLVVTYGHDLKRLQQECGAYWLDLRVLQQVLMGCGTPETLTSLRDLLDKELVKLDVHGVFDEKNDCPVCLCPIDQADSYTLEACRHAYCKACIHLLLQNACQTRELPVQCAAEGCLEGFCLADARSLLGRSEECLHDIAAAALEAFMAVNDKKYKFCRTPDCIGVYRITKRRRVFKCPLCNDRTCSACHQNWHQGKCHSDVDSDEEVEEWMRRCPHSRAACPKCGVRIEKDGGCAHVECFKCHGHICWHCKKFFDSSERCYAHLESNHGSYN